MHEAHEPSVEDRGVHEKMKVNHMLLIVSPNAALLIDG